MRIGIENGKVIIEGTPVNIEKPIQVIFKEPKEPIRLIEICKFKNGTVVIEGIPKKIKIEIETDKAEFVIICDVEERLKSNINNSCQLPMVVIDWPEGAKAPSLHLAP